MIAMYKDQKMLKCSHIARMLGVTVTTVARYCTRGSIKAINYNPNGKVATWRVPVEEIEKLMGMKVMWDENDLPYLVSIK